jgi:intraflagellar transport protein 172
MLYAQDLVNRQKYDEAVSVLAKYLPSTKSQNIPAYIQLCQSTVYKVPSYDQVQSSFYALRAMLFKILRNYAPTSPGFLKLQNLARAVHLLCQQAALAQFGLADLAARASVAAVRYCDVLPADFLFYKAGTVMEKSGHPESAIVYYNAFIDITDVIREGDLFRENAIDHQNFEQTDVPANMCLRATASVPDSTISQINDWLLEKSVSDEFEPQLPLAACPKCGRQIYAATLKCPFCKTVFDFCHITGYPVINPTKCTACAVVSNRADWGLYIARAGRCPCCDSPQTAGA